jgi:putative holliday junction resolvase
VRIAALDFGRKRIGIAVTDDNGSGAYPLGTVERRSGRHDLDAVVAQLAERQVALIVVGLPLNMDGSEGSSARAARRLAERIGTAVGVPVEMQDERLTSFEADDRLRELRASPLKSRRKSDAVAAAVILESWLEKNAHRSTR